MSLKDLVSMSNRYGSDEEYVLAGGGNTSYKENGILYVKGSGAQLSDIKTEQFVAMDIQKLHDMIVRVYPENMSNDERESYALADMMAARKPGEENKRPSVECVLHAIFPYKLVLHLHPPLINGLTCGIDGKDACAELFGTKAVWIDLTKPGLILSQVCNNAFNAYTEKYGKYPQIVILQNHGVFVAADTLDEIDRLMGYVVDTIKSRVKDYPDFSEIKSSLDPDNIENIKDQLKTLYSENNTGEVLFCTNKQVDEIVSDIDSFKPVSKPFSPDHIVYCKDIPLFIEPGDDIAEKFNSYTERKGYKPNIVAVRGAGFFALGTDPKRAAQAKALFLDAIKIAVYAKSFGDANPLPEEFTEFILNWEVEAYRIKT